MRKKLPLTLFSFLLLCEISFAQRDYAALVNPFIGTGGHGHTYPGASMPFGMMQLSPDTREANWDGSSGYHYSDKVIYGFSHTHLSGTGIPDYCDILLMPSDPDGKKDGKDYSGFSHDNEKASPGYYEVLLDKDNIKAQLSTSYHSGMHQYSFPSSSTRGMITIDLKHRDQVLDAFLEQVSKTELRGYRRSRSWARDQTVYFYVKFDQPFTSATITSEDGTNAPDAQKGKNVKGRISFSLPANKMIRCKVGISGVSMEGAQLNVEKEIPAWDFDRLRTGATAAWNKELGKIEIKGGTHDQQVSFYTALYHSFLVPNIYQDVDGQFRGTDLKVHKAEGFTNYTVFSLWDTYRAYHPLMTILNQKRTLDWIKTFLAQYQYGGMLPVWELSGNETFCMIGYHSVPVIVDAFQKGIRGFDTKLAMEAMRSYAESDRFGLKQYRELGYLSNDRESESVSKTLEYAYDDWCIAQFAKMNKNDSVYRHYIRRAQNYKNVFDHVTRHMRGKVQGMWYSPFDPREINNFFTEGNSWQYSFAVPQDIETLMQLHGGREAFAAKLDELFTTSSKTTGREQSDVTGLIGQYAQGNEPSHHMAYLFNYLGLPWRTQELVHKICTNFYKNDPDGLIGNEDCGQMSAWFVLSSMGIYPSLPGSGEYTIGTPLFDEVKINLENGKQFVIKAKDREKGEYIWSAKLNGKSYTKNYILHTDLMNGGELKFEMNDMANKQWGASADDLPHSRITDEPILAAPYFNMATNKFRDKTAVDIKSFTPSGQIYYYVGQGDDTTFKSPVSYSVPFTIEGSCTVTAFVRNKKGEQSGMVRQKFFKVPSDRSISVISKVHPMYTAGGPEALLDGVEGSTNWRAGEWQSYFDQDFEAVVDLQEVKPVHYVGIHVLQDVSPWILYPRELIVYRSDDGKNFMEVAKIPNTVAQTMDSVQTQELGYSANFNARYIRIKAVNGGKLPAWHESAGNPSHLFIDEVIVR